MITPAEVEARLLPHVVPGRAEGERRYLKHDVVHLGVGDDGHTASWPPRDPVADSPRPVDLCGAYRGHVRMTLTPMVVNAARARLVLATGADKAEPVRDWLLGKDSLPLQRVRRTATTVVLDAAAATLLPLVAD